MLDKYRALGVDVDREKAKAEAWLLQPRNQGRQFTKAFFAKWLSKSVNDVAHVPNPANRTPVDPSGDDDLTTEQILAKYARQSKGTP